MHSRFTSSTMLASAGVLLFVAAAAAPAFAADGAADSATNGQNRAATGGVSASAATDIAEGSDIIVTGTLANEIAPVTASLAARQPQSIVSRSLIEDSLPATADFNQIALITPSVSNFNGTNGVGLSESKAQIRGFQDGEYNITYDGVPFGDTNDPTHHSTTFFPSNTIETLVVDRGPGNASQLGQATFGGNINLFSRAVRDDFGGQAKASYGSFDTFLARGLINSGQISALGGARFLVTGQFVDTNGALTYSPYRNYNIFGKTEFDIGPDVRLTIIGTYNQNRFNQPDNDGATLLQTTQFGRNFSLNNNPATPQYFGFNHTTKITDFEIVKLEAHLAPGAVFENRAYTYYYDNETLSATDVTGATANTTTLADAKTLVAGHIPGYTKTNQYRVYGDIAKVTIDFGQYATLTAGAWIEWSRTYRQQTDLDLTTGGFNYIEKAVTAPATGLNPGAVTPRYIRFNQNSRGNQIEEFVEIAIRPFDGLTITPGFKHIDFTRRILATYNQTTRYAQNLTSSYSANLPFVQANWLITPQLSVYGEYAQGFLAPPLNVLYVANPQLSTVEPQRSRNYQTGIVYHGNRLSLDFDLYSIEFTNKFASSVSPVAGVGTVFTNIGGALYQGVEGQATYAIMPGLAAFANGSRNRAIDNTTRRQVNNAPYTTFAGGVIVRHGPMRFSLIDKYTGPQLVTGVTTATNGGRYRISPHNTAILAASYEWGPLRFGIEVTDLFDATNVTNIKTSSKTLAASVGQPLATNFDQYYFQPGRSVTGDVTFRF